MSKQSQSRQFRNRLVNRLGSRRGLRVTAAAAAGLGGMLMASQNANAQTYTWSSATTASFSNGFDGSPAVSNSPTGQFVFTSTSAQGGYTATNDINPLQLNSLSVYNGNTSTPVYIASAGSGLNASQNALTFDGANPQINFTGPGTTNVSSPITSVSGMVYNNSGSGIVQIAGSQVFASNSTTTIINSGAGQIITADCTTVPNYGLSNVLLNLANTGTGQFLLGDISTTSAQLYSGINGVINVSQGTVTAANTGGDLFDNTTVLNIAAGATFNFNNNAETMGGISGAGNIIQGTAGLDLVEAGNRAFSGNISGSGYLYQDNPGTLTLTGTNSFSGNIRVETGGTLVMGGSFNGNGTVLVEAGGTLILGGFYNGSGATTVGSTTGQGTLIATAANALSPNSTINVTDGYINLNGFNQTIAGLSGGNLAGSMNLGTSTLTLNPGTGVFSFNTPLIGAGNVVIGGTGVQALLGSNTYTGSTNVSAGTLRINPIGEQTSGISVATGATLDLLVPSNLTWTGTLTGTGSLFKEGAGTLTFNAPTGLTASTIYAAAGTLVLDHTTNNSAQLGTAPALNWSGGSLSFLGNSSALSNQNFSSFTLGGFNGSGGAGSLSVTSGLNQNANVSLGAITRNFGATVDFNTVNTGTGSANILTTTANTNGIIGGFATFNQSNWATVSSGKIVPLPPASYSNTFGTGLNTQVSTGTAAIATVTTNSIALLSGGVTFTTSAQILTLTSGGILVPAGTNVATNIGSSTVAGVLKPTTNDLIINNYGSQPLTIYSVIQNASSGVNTNVTISGTGTTILTPTNTYTGTTYINGGTVEIANTRNLGATADPIVINGGTFYTTPTSTFGSTAITSTYHPLTIGPAGATFTFNDTAQPVSFQGNGLYGTGTLVVNGPGSWSVGTNASTFSGNIILQAGELSETSNQLTSATGLTIQSGAEFRINDNGVSNWGISGGAPIYVAGAGSNPTYPGAIALSVQSSATTGPTSTITNPVILTGNTQVGVYSANQSGVVYHSVLLFSGAITGPGNLTKLGTDTLILTNPSNAFGGSAGTTALSQGTLKNGANNVLPITTTLQFGQQGSATAATYDLAGFNQSLGGLSVAGGSGHQIINSSATNASVLTINYNGATPQTFSQQLGGGTVGTPVNNNISLVKTGTGVFNLTGTNTFSGPVTVSAGTLGITGNASTVLPTAYTVADGAGLAVTQTDPTQALQMTSLTIGNTATTNLAFTLNGAPSTSAGTINVTGSNGLTLNGNINVSIGTTAPLYTGIYQLISYNGTIGGAGFSALNQTLALPNRVTATLIPDPNNQSAIDLDVTYVDYLKWSGAISGNWDINTTANWTLNSNGSAQTYQESPASDAVVFDQTAVGTANVNLTTTLSPASVSVTGSTNYNFSGSGSIAGGGGLSMTGPGTLTITTNNTYTGKTIINSGTIQVGNGGATGSLGSGAITNNGTLIFNQSGNVIVTPSITGSGSLTQAGAGSLTLNGSLNLGGNLSIPNGSLTIAGSGIVAGDITGPGGLTVAYGPLQIGNGGTSGTLQTNVTLVTLNSTVGSLVFDRTDSSTSSANISGTGNLLVSGGDIKLTGSLSYTGTTTVNANTTLELGQNFNTSYPGLLIGTGTIIKSGTGLMTILASDTNFTGTFIVNGGSVLLTDANGNSTGGNINATSIIINNGGRFIFGQGGITGENPNFPNSTFLTINTGGTYESRVGEDWGATSLQGGTMQLNGGNVTFQATPGSNVPFLGFDLQSGTVQALVAGTVTSANTSGGLIKTTTGTVNFVGPVSVGTTTPILIKAGTLSFVASNIPATGNTSSAMITLGDQSTTGTLQMIDTASAATVRPVFVNSGGGVIDLESPTAGTPAGALALNGAISGSGILTETGVGTLVFNNATNSYGGATNISSGTLELTRNGILSSSSAINVNTGATLLLDGSSNTTSGFMTTKFLGNLNIAAGGSVVAAASTLHTNRLLVVPASISMAGSAGAWTGRIDLTNNDLDVPNGNVAALTSMVRQGYNGGAWNGANGIISSAAANDSTHLTALAVIQNSIDGTTTGGNLWGNGGSGLGLFDGQSPSNTDVLVKFTYYGDTNLDGVVDGTDYGRIDASYGAETPANPISGWFNGDFNYDGVVNGSDYTLIDNTFNTQGTSQAAQIAAPTAQIGAPSGNAAVPEPSLLGVVAVAAMSMLGRRRKRI